MFSPPPIAPRPHTVFWPLLAASLIASPSISVAQAPPEARKQAPRLPWRAFGKVSGPDGKPMAGVEVRAYCGEGTLRQTGSATSGEDGRYEMDFGPGIMRLNGDGVSIQFATISARKPGYFEENLNRQGGCSAADGMPDEAQMKLWDAREDRLFLPDRPLEINFSMRPAARVSGKLVDEQGKPLAGYGVGLSGTGPPSMGAVRGATADDQGRFTLEDIPTTFRYQFVVRKSDPRPPWDDSWAARPCDSSVPSRATCGRGSASGRSASRNSSSVLPDRGCTVVRRRRSPVTRGCSTSPHRPEARR